MKHICIYIYIYIYSITAVPAPTVSIHNNSTPYNGTVFTLTGVVQLHQIVDTDITVLGVWSSGGSPLQTTSQPYQTNLTFQPLTSNSSGEYLLTVTVRHSDNSPFIIGSSGRATYNLVVQCKLFHFHSCVHS